MSHDVVSPQLPTTNKTVIDAATYRGKIPQSGLMLLGVYLRGADSVALLRESNGKVHRIKPGERIGSATAVAFGEDFVQLNEHGRTIRLEIPTRAAG